MCLCGGMLIYACVEVFLYVLVLRCAYVLVSLWRCAYMLVHVEVEVCSITTLSQTLAYQYAGPRKFLSYRPTNVTCAFAVADG